MGFNWPWKPKSMALCQGMALSPSYSLTGRIIPTPSPGRCVAIFHNEFLTNDATDWHLARMLVAWYGYNDSPTILY
ncbi:hypothetical protein SCP_1100280 [Sparassis crispa]|uniref:Uncharacterized protein n=1 Tax=Sparassis crispa TaxID=139825 RepID=A0A401GYW2_9APHY|nr:hypothetical protein SCP_1100280 [Sparassis crispa]GBE87353.1 hypothetical protein SCP_1100280 [Sparassis crispa]